MLSLSPEPTQTLAGRTYYSDSILGAWRKPTGVYLPPGTDTDKGFIDVLLYLHGWYVPTIESLFNTDRAKVRKQVLASGKNVALVAPWLGLGGTGTTYKTSDLTGNWGELYINDVLNALVPPALPKPDLFRTVGLIPRLRVRNLIVACHSGGGAGMRRLVGALGRYKQNLVECWGFDCLYGGEDATFWYDWANSDNGRPLYVSFADSTAEQSVKLFLMKEGLADRNGARANPKGPQISSIEVELAVSNARPMEDVMDLKSLPARDSQFVQHALNNLNKNAGWPPTKAGRGELHYAAARDFLLDLLKTTRYL